MRSGVVGGVHWGLYLSISCNEAYARIDVERVLAASESRFTSAEETAWALKACRSWPEAQGLDADGPNVVLDVPTLILMGELDSVIPAENADIVRSFFPAGRTVVSPTPPVPPHRKRGRTAPSR